MNRALTHLCDTCRIDRFERRNLAGGVVHERATLKVGLGPHANIGIHRVYKPRATRRSRRTESVMLVHGSNVGFEGTFLTGVDEVLSGSTSLEARGSAQQALPIFLARSGVDVWGIDFRWVLVEADTEDLSFMAEWGQAFDAADLDLGLRVARLARFLTGDGWNKMDLLGYSRGGRTSYVYLNDESQRPRRRRQVDRLIHIDVAFKSTLPGGNPEACERAEAVQAQIDGGDVALDNRILTILGELAIEAPDAPSPVMPGLTNLQVAIGFGTLPTSPGSSFHLFAGRFEEGAPVDLAFTRLRTGLDLLASVSAFQPRAGSRDALITLCNSDDDELDDHLEDVVVPVLYIGAAGGNQDFGLATFPFLGSEILESLIVSELPPGDEALDVGHADLLTMEQARERVWTPILDWIRAR